jgi:hypothetical protein
LSAFFIFSTSDPNSKISGRENQPSETAKGDSLNEGAVAQDEVKGERGQGAGEGSEQGGSEQGEKKAGVRTTSSEGPNPFPKAKKAWSKLPAEIQARLQKYARSSATIADAGMVRNFRLAMNELYVRDPDTGKGMGVMVAPASDLSGLLAQMERVQAETGLVPELVM